MTFPIKKYFYVPLYTMFNTLIIALFSTGLKKLNTIFDFKHIADELISFD